MVEVGQPEAPFWGLPDNKRRAATQAGDLLNIATAKVFLCHGGLSPNVMDHGGTMAQSSCEREDEKSIAWADRDFKSVV